MVAGRNRRSLAERLDRLAGWTGIPAMVMRPRPAPRNLRVLPALILAALAIGYTASAIFSAGPQRSFPLSAGGIILFFSAFGAAGWVRVRGPRMMPDVTALDERERMLKARAGSLSGAVIAWAAILGCVYMGVGRYWGLWTPHRALDRVYLALMIEGWIFTLPVLIASWLQPADVDDER